MPGETEKKPDAQGEQGKDNTDQKPQGDGETDKGGLPPAKDAAAGEIEKTLKELLEWKEKVLKGEIELPGRKQEEPKKEEPKPEDLIKQELASLKDWRTQRETIERHENLKGVLSTLVKHPDLIAPNLRLQAEHYDGSKLSSKGEQLVKEFVGKLDPELRVSASSAPAGQGSGKGYEVPDAVAKSPWFKKTLAGGKV